MIPAETEHLKIVTELFPQVVNRGLPDFSCNIHSFGCTYWTSLGQRAGFSAICEIPAPNLGRAALKGDNVISDSAWFPKFDDFPVVLVEFERYSDTSDIPKLTAKVQNLLLAFLRWQQHPTALVLAYWTRGLRNLPNHQVMRDIIRNGFTTAAREVVPGSRQVVIRFFQFVFEASVPDRWKLVRIIERGIE